ncbi:MAG: aldehyde ferredoxin oxidoreductase C-terminal domain-containing protein, partial [Oscillospiraceae bacterium]|nr:aldehyde ferredoxin oxidoreductase C-terminal domain-containing protein [Oscillospiraceae bacterium]
MYGYQGKLLFVDLSEKSLDIRDLPEEIASNFIGGPGLGAYYLYKLMPANTDPFAPESVIVVTGGACVGTGAFFANRTFVINKSPVTGGFNDSNAGGLFSTELKKAGFDAIIIKGASETPVYLHIKDGVPELCDASEIWGKTIPDVEDWFVEKYGVKRPKVLSIGPAGENLSYVSGTVTDRERVAARGGNGAVFGSKKLKSIFVEGTKKVEVFDPELVKELNAKCREGIPKNPLAQAFSDMGSNNGLDLFMTIGKNPVKNWGGSIEDLPLEEMLDLIIANTDSKWKKRIYACMSCPLHCGAVYDVSADSQYGIKETPRPEYETYASYGTIMMVKDAQLVFYMNQRSNDYGIDTISVGNTISWAMECYENGVLTKDDLDGVELTWGNEEAVKEIFDKMCKNEGCGKILNLGSYHAAKAYGKGEEYLQVAGNIEIGQHDPREEIGTGRVFAYDPTPGRHMRGGLGGAYTGQDFRGTGYADVYAMTSNENCYNAGLCNFAQFPTTGGMEGMQKWIYAATGLLGDERSYYFAGLRSFLIRQAFNLREGQRRKDWYLTPRLRGEEPIEGPLKGRKCDVDKLGDNFFEALGCDIDTGVPLPQLYDLV